MYSDLNKNVNDRMKSQMLASQKALKQRQEAELKRAENTIQISENELQRIKHEEGRIKGELSHTEHQAEAYQKRLDVLKSNEKVTEGQILQLKNKIQSIKNDLPK